MDKNKEHILINGQDKTEEILSCQLAGKVYKIIFANKPEKTYTISKDKISFIKNELNNALSRNTLDYLKNVADVISLQSEDGNKFLAKQYEKIGFVREDTVLAKYLSAKPADERHVWKQDLIFPFGLNESQKSAVARAFSSQISIIQGPPGTGKTQTILNIIANAIMLKKTVAVVSNNNSATENVVEKLKKYDLDFLTAFLGNTENKKKFVASQNEKYPDMSGWQLGDGEADFMRSRVKEVTTNIDELLAEQNHIAQLKQQIADLETEQRYFEEYYKSNQETQRLSNARLQFNSSQALRMWVECENYYEYGLWNKLVFIIENIWILYKTFGIYFWKKDPRQIIPILQRHYYIQKIEELRDEMQSLEKKLNGFDMADKMRELTIISTRLLADFVARKYSGNSKRKIFTKDGLWQQPQEVNKEYPVILSTTHSIRSSLSKDYIYDYLIIDEASQVDVVTGALALSCAKNVVIVGDLMQLPNIVSKDNAIRESEIWSKYFLDNYHKYSENNSLLASVAGIWPDAPQTLLREHYRCHPKIIGFCNQKFYNNQLVIMTRDNGEQDVLTVYKTNAGSHARGHVNQRQIDVIIREVMPLLGDAPYDSIGVISPYVDQKETLSEQIGQAEIEIDTVHKYQGREKENIIVTTVDNVIGQFVDNPNMLNVAVSRAIRRLRVVISADERNSNTNIGDLVKYIEYNNFDVIDSEIFSVFDLLYKEYAKERQEFLAKNPRVSQYDSENLMYAVILKMLKAPENQTLDCAVHQKLYMLIKNTDRLTDEERNYAMNPWTHLDFVLYNKMDKKPVIVIEIDGMAFHKKGSAQYERDRMKDRILAKYNIPIKRIATDSSGEKGKIETMLGMV